MPRGVGDVVLAQDRLGLIFVDFHGMGPPVCYTWLYDRGIEGRTSNSDSIEASEGNAILWREFKRLCTK